MGTNPNPGRITDASWWFMGELLALEPGTRSGGIYADKPGYHGSRDDNDPDDYSVREPEDKLGPPDKGAGYDWIFPDAQKGDYRRFAVYGRRVREAFDRRDPRLDGWREYLGQTDLDTAPEGLDFRHRTTRVPDGSHSWHAHLSEDRGLVADYQNKRAMLSVLRGESLEQYLSTLGEDMRPYMLIRYKGQPHVFALFTNGGARWIGPAECKRLLAGGLVIDETTYKDEIARIAAVTGQLPRNWPDPLPMPD